MNTVPRREGHPNRTRDPRDVAEAFLRSRGMTGADALVARDWVKKPRVTQGYLESYLASQGMTGEDAKFGRGK